MKRSFPVALLLCLSFALSSFTPAYHVAPEIKKGVYTYTFPITGSTFGTPGAGQPAGTIYYEINGSGTIPSSITFYTQPGGGVSLGTYPFSLSSPNNYLAGGMKAQTSITAVYFHISNACGSGYCVEFIGGPFIF
jgi:hypothetical protein